MKRVWFNHWFSTAYRFINMLKKENCYIIASNERDTCIYQENADEFYIEPHFEDQEKYLQWMLDFAIKNKIDVFFVKRGMDIVVHNLNKFTELGIKVICETNVELYDTLQDKKATMEYFSQFDIFNIPEMVIVNTCDEFKKAYKEMSKRHETLCIKYNKDEGGQSYKKIKNKEASMERIIENEGTVFSYDYLCECLSTTNRFNDLIVMPYLEGTEISIDCIGVDDGLVAIPRYKLSNRVTQIDMDDELIDIANKVYEVTKLNGPFNIQFRYSQDKLYLLEINTRLSGGSWKASNIGCRFPSLCYKKSIGEAVRVPQIDKKIVRVSNLESCVIL